MDHNVIQLVEAVLEIMRGLETNSPPHRIANFTRAKKMLTKLLPKERDDGK
jgi:hypothetical protein